MAVPKKTECRPRKFKEEGQDLSNLKDQEKERAQRNPIYHALFILGENLVAEIPVMFDHVKDQVFFGQLQDL